MTPREERRLQRLYSALRETAAAAEGARVDLSRSYLADPLYYARFDRGFELHLTDPGGRELLVTVPKTLRVLRLAVDGTRTLSLELDLREGYELGGVRYRSARDLAGAVWNRLTGLSMGERHVGREAATLSPGVAHRISSLSGRMSREKRS